MDEGFYDFFLRRLAADEAAPQPKNETLEEHRKHCEAKPGNCPFEKRLEKREQTAAKEDAVPLRLKTGGKPTSGPSVESMVSVLRSWMPCTISTVSTEDADAVAECLNATKASPDKNGGDLRFMVRRVFTGGSADFEKPSLAFVGSGDGGTSQGWGLYGTNRRRLAVRYAKGEDAPPRLKIDGKPYNRWKGVTNAQCSAFHRLDALIYKKLDQGLSREAAMESAINSDSWSKKERTLFEKYRERMEYPPRVLYQQTFFTDRAPGDESHLLKWLDPVPEEQMGWILSQARKEGVEMAYEPRTGEEAYRSLMQGSFASFNPKKYKSSSEMIEAKDKAVAQFLVRAGIDGVKCGSDRSVIYVSFRDDNIRVDHKWVDGEKRFAKGGIEGQIQGWYNRRTGDVSLVKGRATADTVAHELGWHATFHWAQKNHPALYNALVQYARDAPQGIVDSVKAKYGGSLSEFALLDEVGAERFTREDISPLLEEASRRDAAGWFDGVEKKQNEARSAFRAAQLESITTLPRKEIDRIAMLPSKRAVAELVSHMVAGRALPKTPTMDAETIPADAGEARIDTPLYRFVFDGDGRSEPVAPALSSAGVGGDAVRRLFAPGDFARYGKGGAGGDMIVDMAVDTYLGLCEPIPADDAKRHADLAAKLKSGEIRRFDHIPMLAVKLMEDGDDAKVIGHDGRHRALLLKEAGCRTVPVRLMAFGFKWGAPLPERTVNGKDVRRPWPKWLWCQNDRSREREQYRFRFPVAEADSGRAYEAPDGGA